MVKRSLRNLSAVGALCWHVIKFSRTVQVLNMLNDFAFSRRVTCLFPQAFLPLQLALWSFHCLSVVVLKSTDSPPVAVCSSKAADPHGHLSFCLPLFYLLRNLCDHSANPQPFCLPVTILPVCNCSACLVPFWKLIPVLHPLGNRSIYLFTKAFCPGSQLHTHGIVPALPISLGLRRWVVICAESGTVRFTMPRQIMVRPVGNSDSVDERATRLSGECDCHRGPTRSSEAERS